MHGTAIFFGVRQGGLHVGVSFFVNQRADKNAIFKRITDFDRFISGNNFRKDLVLNILMHDQTTQGCATLTTGANSREHNRTNRHINVCRRGYDHGIVAAKLKNGTTKTLGNTRRNFAAHAGRTSCRNQRHIAAVGHNFTDLAIPNNNLMQVGWRITEFRNRLFQNLLAGQGGNRGFFRRFPNHGIATCQRKGSIPRPWCDREVKGGDQANNTQRMPIFHHFVARTFGRDGQTVKLARQAKGEIADVDHFLNFAKTFLIDLATFKRHQTAKRFFGRAELITQKTDQFAAAWTRNLTPCAKCLFSIADHIGHFGRGGFSDICKF